MRVRLISCFLAATLPMAGWACGSESKTSDTPQTAEQRAKDGPKSESEARAETDATKSASKPAPAPKPQDPVPLWKDGKVAGEIDAATAAAQNYLVIDLGEAWTPYLFTEDTNEEGKLLTNAYRKTYLQLARGEWPDNHHGERAEQDKYLELYGIMPTLSVLRDRFHATEKLSCRKDLDLQPLVDFNDVVTYRSNDAARKAARDFAYLRNQVKGMVRKQKVADESALNEDKLKRRDMEILRRYRKLAPDYYAVDAMQKRLKCEGFFKGRGRYVHGAMDWPTHDALAEFERRHRVYSWGYIGRDSLQVLRVSPMEAEREAVLRLLTERAVHAAGVLEDGSMSFKRDDEPRTFKGVDGQQHPIPNLVEQLRQNIVEAFALQTPEGALAFLDALGELTPDGSRRVAIRGIELPEYYDGVMELTLRYDRGDVWYDFPFDAEGKEQFQPVSRRPQVTVFTRYNEQWIPLARFGTTIGGWRSEFVDGTVMWKYKDSPVGPRVWERIVAAPVWLPPDGTPPRDILKKRLKRKRGEPEFEVNYHETGPSYASAYGLVAAYHRKFMRRADGTIAINGDEGIRTHGSVDYMSIMRRHSHGCHRLHNHIAVRLMSFVLAHRPHKRVGQQPVAFHKELEYEDVTYPVDITVGGYIFELETPLQVVVEEGRVRGKVDQPIDFPVPKYDEDLHAYIMPDGRAVELRGRELVEVPLPVQPDAGVPMPSALDSFLTDVLDTSGAVTAPD